MFNPVTPQAAVVVNGIYDTYGIDRRRHRDHGKLVYTNSGTDNENYSLMMHDLVFRTANDNDRWKVMQCTKNNPRLQVFSSFIGLEIYNQYTERPSIVFVGSSLTTMPYDEARSKRSPQVAIRIAGSDTIKNTGEHIVDIGDTICWDYPKDTDGRNKLTGVKRGRYSDGGRLTARVMTENTLREELEQKKVTEIDRIVRERVIGIALSFAQPNDT